MTKTRKRSLIAVLGGLTLISVLLAPLLFGNSYLRLFESFGDLFTSIKVYAAEVFGLNVSDEPTVEGYSKIFPLGSLLPADFESFKASIKTYFELYISKDNFQEWTAHLGQSLVLFSQWLTLLLPILAVGFLIMKRIYGRNNTKDGTDTKPLRAYKRLSVRVFLPIKAYITDCLAYIKQHPKLWKAWIWIWVLNLNLASIVVAFVAFYLDFAATFPIGNVYVQLVKLLLDLQVLVKFVPTFGWVIIGFCLFDLIRKSAAKQRLNHLEARNCGFINELPIVSMTCGSMGKKKTTVITDMALSQEVMFRQKALDILQKCDLKFSNFPWLLFEKELQKCMEYGTVYNLATVKDWIAKKRSRFNNHGNTDLQLYGYDFKRYGTDFDDCLKVSHLFDVLETYALAYFIYITESSLIVSNYSIRTDNELMILGNFPIWNTNFFSQGYPIADRFAHILDFDALRLGRKVLSNNVKTGSFEFGVVAITEIGKERGNTLELKEVKKKSDDTNQKNDLFNSWLKMCRHSATVDNYPFIKVFTDEQRPESWGADARDLCDILNIASSSEQTLVLPFYAIEDVLSEWITNKFLALYYDFRYRRGDNTLLVHLLKKLAAFAFRRIMQNYNKYGYCTVKIEKRRGTMDGKIDKKKYFLMNRKIYSRRFSTDCFSDYFNDLAKRTKVGLRDYLEYATEKASVTELKAQNSYFINGLYNDEDR